MTSQKNPLNLSAIRVRVAQYITVKDAISCAQVSKSWSKDFVPVVWHTVNLAFQKHFIKLDQKVIAKKGIHIRTINNLKTQPQVEIFLRAGIRNLHDLTIALSRRSLPQAFCYDLIRRNNGSLRKLRLVGGADDDNWKNNDRFYVVPDAIIPSPGSAAPSKLTHLIIRYVGMTRESFSVLLRNCPALVHLDMWDTDISLSKDSDVYRHPGVKELIMGMEVLVSKHSPKRGPALSTHFPNLERWNFHHAVLPKDCSLDMVKNAVATNWPRLSAIVTKSDNAKIVQDLLLRVFGGLSDVTLNFKKMPPEVILAVIIQHQNTLKHVRDHLEDDDTVYNDREEPRKLDSHHQQSGWMFQSLLSACALLQTFHFPHHELGLDDMEQWTWKCRGLRDLRVRIRGLDTAEKTDLAIAKWVAARRWKYSVADVDTISDVESDWTMDSISTTVSNLARETIGGGLHEPGNPLVLGNVYDAATASIIVSLPTAKAVATASYAIAATEGVDDDDMTKEQNLAAIKKIARVVVPTKLPLTADLQDGYEDVKDTIRQAIAMGAVGCNLEDVDIKAHKLRTLGDAVQRVKEAMEAAREAGVPEFAVNARTDVLCYGGTIEEAIERGKAYLAVGANTVFVWGGPSGRGVSREEVKQLCEAFDGRLNVSKRFGEGFLSIPELREIGVARVSVGPGLFRIATNAYKEAAESLLSA
ncbi:hypothetical protein BG011_003811 [Mortierella polycephala]|uniref:Uncharacterized protein n=1 Tax=Mortierella polycephala TaxID=41804 RepID=A0A9P6Q256_9FUNG|nr:hypothetical protein BG011_003811 [Mortierella polycephala]